MAGDTWSYSLEIGSTVAAELALVDDGLCWFSAGRVTCLHSRLDFFAGLLPRLLLCCWLGLASPSDDNGGCSPSMGKHAVPLPSAVWRALAFGGVASRPDGGGSWSPVDRAVLDERGGGCRAECGPELALAWDREPRDVNWDTYQDFWNALARKRSHTHTTRH